MRHTRWLFLAAIVSLLVVVGGLYIKQKADQARGMPSPPDRLQDGIESISNGWKYIQLKGNRPGVIVQAKQVRTLNGSSVMQLEGVQIQLFHADGEKYDLVKSEKAVADTNAKTLYSDGEVDITMGVDANSEPHGRLLKIHGSGVHFDIDSGKATTDRYATFQFGQGGGSAVGADYDPTARELHLHNKVALDWPGKKVDSKPMRAEAGQAIYYERQSKVLLQPWSRLIRDTLQMDAGVSEVQLDKGEIRSTKSMKARGVQDDPDRKVEYAADELDLNFGDGMVITTVHGDKNARLISTAQASRTTVTSDRMDLNFAVSGKQSTLDKAVATGKSEVEAVPLPRPGVTPPETRILKSEVVRLNMRPGGRDIDKVETDGPGTLDFLPNRPEQSKRSLHGDRIWIDYGDQNRIQKFRSVNVTTRTEKPEKPEKPDKAGEAPDKSPMLTQSKEMVALFDPKTSEVTRIDQTTDFHYEEGDRRAQADHATLDQTTTLITLDKSARAWDPTGSIVADRIVMNQKTSDTIADGHVQNTRQPNRKGNNSAMLSNDEVLQATAEHMTTTDKNQKIHYEGNAKAWQGANRVDADRIDMDNEHHIMEAHGKVVSQFVDKSSNKSADGKAGVEKSAEKAKAPGPPVFTTVHAPDLTYSADTRIAYYSGGVHLERPDLIVDSHELHAYLKPGDSDNSLDKAFADGAVKIVSLAIPKSDSSKGTAKPSAGKGKDKRTRTGTSEHAEYYPDDQKVLLRGGNPQLVDSLSGKSACPQELIWFANSDTLQCIGEQGKPAETTIRKK